MDLGPKEAIRMIQIHPTSVVTTINEEGSFDAAAFSFLSPVSFDPPMVAVMVSPDRYTYENLKNGGEFVVNVLTKHYLEEIMYVGKVSFEDNPNKLEESELNLKDAEEVEPSRIEEAVGWLECEVEDIHRAGDHYIVVGKIICASVVDEFWDDGRFLAEEAETLHHLGGNKFLVGGNVVEWEEE
ncbi:MAG: flavin reductase family protein [Candidatus Aenigmatarchaeota archaeon]